MTPKSYFKRFSNSMNLITFKSTESALKSILVVLVMISTANWFHGSWIVGFLCFPYITNYCFKGELV
jgi:nitric oxide reductase large subunit